MQELINVENKPKELFSYFYENRKKSFIQFNNRIVDFKNKSFELFNSQNFPTLKDEEWRYTNISPILSYQYFLPDVFDIENKDIENIKLLKLDAYKLIFFNGKFVPELSSMKEIKSLTAIRFSDVFAQLQNPDEIYLNFFGNISNYSNIFKTINAILYADGYYLKISEGANLEKPILVLFLYGKNQNPAISSVRNLIVAEKNSSATIIEASYNLDEGIVFENNITEVIAEQNSKINFVKLQKNNKNTFHFSDLATEQKENSNFNAFTLTFGSNITRNEAELGLNGEYASGHLYGLFISKGKTLIDNHTSMYHIKPHCESNQLYKGILFDRSRGVFRGRIKVAKNAQKTNAYQSNMNLLMSDFAQINSKPQLEIFADDVKCTHGATVGQIDENALFYLRSRGLEKEYAKSLLILAFANEIIENIENDNLKDSLQKIIFDELSN